MKRLLFILFLPVGCSMQPAGPTSVAATETKILTSRVNPEDFEDSFLEHLSTEHNIWDPNVSLCRTKQREYCDAKGAECWWETDYYTVLRPDVCPLEPIP